MKPRYVFEHIMLPYLLDRRGGDVVSVLLLQKSSLLYKLCASAYAQEGEEFSGSAEDFGFDAARLDGDTVCLTLKMPAAAEPGDCEKIYILVDGEPFHTSYFTSELDAERSPVLCGQSGDVRLTFGSFPDEKKALALMLGVHRDNKDN